jgi:tRNA pseudouridine13 synthase
LVNEVLPSGQVLHLQNIPQPMSKADKEAAVQKSKDAEKAAADAVAKEKEATEALRKEHEETKASENGGAGKIEKTTKTTAFELSEEHRKELVSVFGEAALDEILKLHAKIDANPGGKSKEIGTVTSEVIDDKDDRTKAHQAVRRIFKGRFETFTSEKNTILVSKSAGYGQARGGGKWSRNTADNQRAKGKLAWQEVGGEYLHFTLYKENKDTMESIGYMCSQLKMQPKGFQFAGTKDRRGVTVQRVAVYRVQADRLAGLNRSLNNSAIGDFKYEATGLKLGDLLGNEFTVTLRDCHFPGEDGLSTDERIELGKTTISNVVSQFQKRGFINYYGLQRFGSFANGTDQVGKKLLQEDLKGAIDMILDFHPSALAVAEDGIPETKVSSDDRARAQALDVWRRTRNTQQALQLMPRKFSAEANIIRHLGAEKKGVKIHQQDWQGAISGIVRNLRLMYVHAYQSLVWNVAAGKRWELYGDKVVEGDLVIVGAKDGEDEVVDEVDELGEPVVLPGIEDSSARDGDFERARPLSKTEAESGKYDIFDVVLPLPGWDVSYPKNESGEFYKEFMGSERGGGLDPHKMHRKWKDISLSGGYRKFMAKTRGGLEWEIRTYRNVDEKLVETDWDRLEKAKGEKNGRGEEVEGEETEDGEMDVDDEERKIAVILKFQLGSSQYATMALRELMKADGVKSYVPDFGGRG